MTLTAASARLATAEVEAHQQFVDLVNEVRPELFKYCARMTGSIFDGEDIVQETLARAYSSLRGAHHPPLKPWLFHVAHNAAMDFLKRHERKHVTLMAEPPDASDEDESATDAALLEAALLRFVVLPPLQRSALVLKDVLGHSLVEAAATMGTTVAAVKAALVRARATLAAAAPPPTDEPRRRISAEERGNLRRYADLFNGRDWDALRALMGEESRLDVVMRTRRRGAAAAEYYARYAELAPQERLRAEPGWADGTPVVAIYRPDSAPSPAYFVLIEWMGDKVALVRDFRYVPYLAAEARYTADVD